MTPKTLAITKPYALQGSGTATQTAGWNNIEIDIPNIHPNAVVTITGNENTVESITVTNGLGIAVNFTSNGNEDSDFSFSFVAEDQTAYKDQPNTFIVPQRIEGPVEAGYMLEVHNTSTTGSAPNGLAVTVSASNGKAVHAISDSPEFTGSFVECLDDSEEEVIARITKDGFEGDVVP